MYLNYLEEINMVKQLKAFLLLFIIFLIITIQYGISFSETLPCKEISAPEVKNLLDHDKAVAIHVLSSFEYDIQHISKSINIPVNKMEQQLDKLPKDKNFPIIFYCMGHR